MRKKAFITFMMAVLVGAMLAGCGKKAEKVDSSNVVIEEEEQEQEPEEIAEPEETAEPEPEPEPEEEPAPLPYAVENGMVFFQGTSFTTKGIRYNPDAPDAYDVIDVEAEILGITVADAEQEGYQTITIETVSTGQIWSDGMGNNKLGMSTPGFDIFDMYTGRVVPGAYLVDGEVNEMQYRTELEWEGEAYSIGYTRDFQSKQGEWSGDFCPFSFYNTYRITVPKEYDGLALFLTPRREYEESEAGVIDEEEKYVLDYRQEGIYLFRVNDLLTAFGI